MAGIHESVPNQNAKPLANHQPAAALGRERRVSASIGASANAISTVSFMGGNAAHMRNAVSPAANIFQNMIMLDFVFARMKCYT